MAKMLLILTCALIAAAPVNAAEELEYTLLSDFPSPGPSPQGLAWDGEALWCVDDSTDTVYRIDTSTQSVIHTLPAPCDDARDMAWDGEYLWVADAFEQKIFAVDPMDGITSRSIEFTKIYINVDELWGVYWDGPDLWMSTYAGYSSIIRKIDPDTGSFINRDDDNYKIANALSKNKDYYISLMEIAEYQGMISFYYDSFLQNPSYYPQVHYIFLPTSHTRGLAVDNNDILWITDHDTDVIYSIKVKYPASGIDMDSNTEPIRIIGNFPNPFNPSTTIAYTIPDAGHVTLDVYSLTGQKVATLVDSFMGSGKHTVVFDGSGYGAGMYFYRLTAGGMAQTGKMLLMK